MTGYQYSRELNILSKICTVTSDATPMLKVIGYFPNLTKLELDERAVLSWGTYLGLLVDILTSLPHLSDLTLRHRLLNENDEPEVFDKSPIIRKLERGIVSKLRALTIILGRKWEESKMTSYRFSELVDVIGLATAEVTSFRLYASYTKLSAETIMERCSEDNFCSKLSLPKLESADIHVRGFADTGALEYITDDSLKRVKRLRFVGNAWEPDLDTVSLSISIDLFENDRRLTTLCNRSTKISLALKILKNSISGIPIAPASYIVNHPWKMLRKFKQDFRISSMGSKSCEGSGGHSSVRRKSHCLIFELDQA